MRTEKNITFLGRTDFRDGQKAFGIRQADRRSHMYIIGQTGTGKSTLLETLIRQDIHAGRGLALLDPHGDLIERVRRVIPEERRQDLVYFDVPDAARPLGFNPLAGIPPGERHLAASGLLEVFKKIWAESWGPRLEHILRNALLTLLDQPLASLADVLRLLNDPLFRRHAVERIQNAQIRDFWLREYDKYPERLRAEAIAPIQNKVGAFLTHPLLNRILTQQKSSFELRQVMDQGRILLVNLAKGRIGSDAATLLGALLASSIGLAGIGRANVAPSARPDFYLYLDEFHLFTTQSLADMLSELRKYHVGLVLAHQYLGQLDLAVRDAVLGNVGTTICFRVGLADAEILAEGFAPEIPALDLIHLPNYHLYLRLMVEGVVSRPFSAETLPPADPLLA